MDISWKALPDIISGRAYILHAFTLDLLSLRNQA